jgi:hypothetical protein
MDTLEEYNVIPSHYYHELKEKAKKWDDMRQHDCTNWTEVIVWKEKAKKWDELGFEISRERVIELLEKEKKWDEITPEYLKEWREKAKKWDKIKELV